MYNFVDDPCTILALIVVLAFLVRTGDMVHHLGVTAVLIPMLIRPYILCIVFGHEGNIGSGWVAKHVVQYLNVHPSNFLSRLAN